MALSRQKAPLRNLVAFKAYAKRRGARVGEGLPESRPRAGAHGKGSWHMDTGVYKGVRHSLATDINYGPSGTSAKERDMLRHLMVVGESMGLGLIHARDGIVGAARTHQGHLHADVGSFTNTGRGSRPATPGDLVVWDTQPIIRSSQDNLAGQDTRKRLNALRAASRHGGQKFPYGVSFTQHVVGTPRDGKWGPASRRKHDATMRSLQILWKNRGLYKGAIDMVWGPLMDQARARFISNYGR